MQQQPTQAVLVSAWLTSFAFICFVCVLALQGVCYVRAWFLFLSLCRSMQSTLSAIITFFDGKKAASTSILVNLAQAWWEMGFFLNAICVGSHLSDTDSKTAATSCNQKRYTHTFYTQTLTIMPKKWRGGTFLHNNGCSSSCRNQEEGAIFRLQTCHAYRPGLQDLCGNVRMGKENTLNSFWDYSLEMNIMP